MAAVNFLVLLAKQRWEALRENVGRYPRMEVLFGGPHQSLPSPGRFGVSAGDLVYTVFASGGDLHVMCRSVVREVVPIRRYFVERLGVAESELTTPLWGTIRAL